MNKNSYLTGIYLVTSSLWRLLPHWPNMTPFTALALYSGTKNRSRSGILLPLIPLALTDLFLGLHSTIFFVYISMILIAILGKKLKIQSPLALTGATIASSLLFFVITNLGVWLTSGMYPLTIGGLLTTFTLAIPFYQNALIGDLLFSLVFFGFTRIAAKKHQTIQVN